MQSFILVIFTSYLSIKLGVSVMLIRLRQDTMPMLYKLAYAALSLRAYKSVSKDIDASTGLLIIIALTRAFTVKNV